MMCMLSACLSVHVAKSKASDKVCLIKEKLTIGDEVTQDLLPRAFTRNKAIEALIHEKDG